VRRTSGTSSLGSGFRGTVDALPEQQRRQLRETVITELMARDVTRLRSDVVFAQATRSD